MSDKPDELLAELRELKEDINEYARHHELLKQTLQTNEQAKRLKNDATNRTMYKRIGSDYMIEIENKNADDEIENNIRLAEERLEEVSAHLEELRSEFEAKHEKLTETAEELGI
jgi:chaperonin cofactor prefoldin